MVRKFEDIKHVELTAPRGGKGTGKGFPFDILMGLEGRVKAFNYMHLDNDSAIGFHQHVDDLEIYIIVDGEGIYNDNGTEVAVKKGDVMLCNKGEHHGLASKNGGLDFIAAIIG